jgi:uncharacterized protein YtpQ (UPF0354 family)
MSRSRQTVEQAIAYLKRALPPEPLPGETVVELAFDDTPVLRDLDNGLLVAYLVDEGSSYGYVQNRDLVSAGVSEADLHAAAVKNLRQVADERLRVQPYGEIFALLMGGTFEASMLLLDDLWEESLAGYVAGDVLVAIPARDILAFGSASSPAAVKALNAVIERLLANGNAELATGLYRRSSGRWVAHDA